MRALANERAVVCFAVVILRCLRAHETHLFICLHSCEFVYDVYCVYFGCCVRNTKLNNNKTHTIAPEIRRCPVLFGVLWRGRALWSRSRDHPWVSVVVNVDEYYFGGFENVFFWSHNSRDSRSIPRVAAGRVSSA